MVSVPSRGILFPNGVNSCEWINDKGFRPLSGYLISKWKLQKLIKRITYSKFPSPLGVSYFQMVAKRAALPHFVVSFRPLSGYLISKYTCENIKNSQNSFRPLSGYLISKWRYEYAFTCNNSDYVYVTTRGILYQNSLIINDHRFVQNY